MKQVGIKMINWNVGGAKYLELPAWDGKGRRPTDWAPGDEIEYREQYKYALMKALQNLISRHHPDVITLQEIVQYSASGNPSMREDLMDPVGGYTYVPFPLIDTEQYSAQPKWLKVMDKGGWTSPPRPFFAQGNGFLLKDMCPHYPVWSLTRADADHLMYPGNTGRDGQHKTRVERVDLQTGLYFGDRNTEPRVALVLHLVLPANGRPLDVFVVNLHLTTLRGEREGIPEIDEKASCDRLEQLKVVLDGVVSRYNQWRGNGYKIADRQVHVDPHWDIGAAQERHNPIWVIAGDFNFTRQSAEYQYLTRRNFMDLLPDDKPTKSSGLGKDPTLAVDYIFAGPRFYSFDPVLAEIGIKKNDVIVDDYVRVSDHYPVVANVPIVI